MRNFFIIIFLFTSQVGIAQDDHYNVGGKTYPVWYSRTKALVKFKDLSKLEDKAPGDIARGATNVNKIAVLPGMAFVTFPESDSPAQFADHISELLKNSNIVLAHPLLVTENGKESAGFTDLIIARPKKEISKEAMLVQFRDNGLEIMIEDVDSEKNYYLTGPAVMVNPLRICEKLDQTGMFEFVQPNCLRFVEPAGTPNDPLFAANWGLAKMKLPEAWDITTGCPNIKIAIIDDGVQLNHPDLQPNLLPGFDATPSGTNGGNVAGEFDHGTKCAGFAAAKGNNGIGVTGVAYNSKIIPIRAYSSDFDGNITTDLYVASGINYAINNANADVLNMSWGIAALTIPINNAIEAALQNGFMNGRSGKGAVMVTATGNKGLNTIAPLPSTKAFVFVVGASNAIDKRAPTSNYPTGNVDVVAPGVCITTMSVSSYANIPGEIFTSWSTAMVSGLAALILSVNPSLSELQIRRIIAETADKVPGYNYIVGNGATFNDLSHHNEMGYGRVNALKALEKAAGMPIIGPDLICNNGGYTLSAFPPGSSAIWSASAGLTVAGNLATRQNGYSGNANIFATLTAPNACVSTVKRSIWVGSPNLAKTINGNVAGTISVTPGNIYNLAATSSSPSTTYNYNNYAGSGNVVIDLYTPNSANTQMYVHSNSTNGMRQVKVTATNTCGNYAEDFVFHVPGMAKIYPNPAKDVLVVDFTEYTKMEKLPAQICLFAENSTDPLKVIKTSKIADRQGFNEHPLIQIDVSDLPRATYYLHLIPADASQREIEKIKIILH